MKPAKSLLLLFVAALVAAPSFATGLSVQSTEPIAGTFSMRTTFVGDTGNAIVTDESPATEDDYEAQVKIHMRTMDLAPSQQHNILRARMEDSTTLVFRAVIQRPASDGNPVLYLRAATDGGGLSAALATQVTSQHKITVYWKRSTGVNTNDGIIRLYKGANLINEITTLDNDTLSVGDFNLGAFGGVDASTTGHMDFDDFLSTRVFFAP